MCFLIYCVEVMSTYKVIQDIEAEDHILGPLTLRQFIFALIAIFFFYISFVLFTKGAAVVTVIFLPPGLFFGFFAIPFGRDQPTEVWALAKLRFWLKPRKRVWNQSGVKELVTINAPKKIEKPLTNGLNQYEVESRLKALAGTLDSRGWIVKNATSSLGAVGLVTVGGDSDRLVNIDSYSVPTDDNLVAQDDMLDENSSPSQQFEQMIDESSRVHRQQLINQMNAPAEPTPISNASSQWFMPQAADVSAPAATAPVVTAVDVSAQDETAADHDIAEKIKASHDAQHLSSNNLRTLSPLGNQQSAVASHLDAPIPIVSPVFATAPMPMPAQADIPPLTEQPDTAILSLASSGDNLTVETIAHEAKRAKSNDLDEDEVVIPLH
jgi:hypothetical protein